MKTEVVNPQATEGRAEEICVIALGVVIQPRGGDQEDKTSDDPQRGWAGGEQILISQRRAETVYGGYWEFPGGKVEPGETVEAGLRRELEEELGIAVEPIRPLSPIEHVYPHGHVRLMPFLCRITAGQPTAREVAAWRWVSLDELSHYRFPEANVALVEELQGMSPEE